MEALRCGIRTTIVLAVMCLAGEVGAQESLDQGKSPAQLFASDCAVCHKTPQGLARRFGVFGLDSFLRQHYTASRETATAIANYVRSMDTGPAATARPIKRAARGDDKTRPGQKKKPEARTAEPKSLPPKSSQPKSTEILAPEPKSAPGEARPVDGGKSD